MAAALECWSGRPSTDEDMVEQVLMTTNDRSEAAALAPAAPPQPSSNNGGNNNKKWQRIGRNFAGAIASLKSSLNLDSPSQFSRLDKLLWGGVVRNLTSLHPGSQLPDRLISSIRRHFDALPNSYAQAGFDIKDVLLHVRLVELAAAENQPAFHVQEATATDDSAAAAGTATMAFACNSPLSWPAISGALDAALVCCKRTQIFEKKGLTLGVLALLVQPGGERHFKPRIEAALKAAIKKTPKNSGVKLTFGLCGCQEESFGNLDDSEARPESVSSFLMSVDEWQTVHSGGDDIGRWLLNAGEVEFIERAGPNSFKGLHRGKKVWIKKLKGCEQGNAYEVEVRRDLLQLMTCGHRSILQFHGVSIDENHGMCVVTRMMECGSAHDLIQRSSKVAATEVVRIAQDVAEGLKFMNERGIAYKDLNVQRILLDRQGSACLGDMGIASSCCNAGEVTEYETAGYRWLAPEIIAGDPESVTETWMSNVYSYGMVVWEMVTGEEAYASFSPVQAAVGIAACGLRPEIPQDCPQVLRSLMLKCWNNCPPKRPTFSEIITHLQRHNNR